MNIFVLSRNPDEAAVYQCDKHVNKMTLEGVQILNGALYERGLDNEAFYGYTHKHHPCTLWAAESWYNFAWLCRHVRVLSFEHMVREDNDQGHLSYRKMAKNWFGDDKSIPTTNKEVVEKLDFADKNDSGMTEYALAMPDDCKQGDPVKAYRKYYREYKSSEDWFSYEKSPHGEPDWL